MSSSAALRLPLPVLGLGTGSYPFNFDTRRKLAALHAIELGYRHFDTASLYHSEQGIGEVIAEALDRGLINSRSDVFITSKLWCTDAHPHLVLPAIRESLRNLKLDYLDLYLIHWSIALKPPGAGVLPVKAEDILPFDLKSVWEAMEECQRLGLTKSIGFCNFTRKKILELLEIAKIPPMVYKPGGIESSLAASEAGRGVQGKGDSCRCIFSYLGSSFVAWQKSSDGIRGASIHSRGKRKVCGTGRSFNCFGYAQWPYCKQNQTGNK